MEEVTVFGQFNWGWLKKKGLVMFNYITQVILLVVARQQRQFLVALGCRVIPNY